MDVVAIWKTIVGVGQMSNNQLVKKHNALIEAHYKLSLTQQKIIIAVISTISIDDVDFKDYTISIKEFQKIIGASSSKNNTFIRKAAQNLLKKPLSIRLPGNKTVHCNWFSSIIHPTRGGEGSKSDLITFHFDPILKPYMLQLKNNFTLYNKGNIMCLRKKYSIRLYELLKQYLKIGYRKFSLVDLKASIGIDGMYPIINSFEQKVLKLAKKEINKETDIYIEYQFIKTNREVTHVEFTIAPNTIDKSQQLMPTENSDIIVSKGIDIGIPGSASYTVFNGFKDDAIIMPLISKPEVWKWVKERCEDTDQIKKGLHCIGTEECLLHVKYVLAGTNSIRNKEGYLITCIKTFFKNESDFEDQSTIERIREVKRISSTFKKSL